MTSKTKTDNLSEENKTIAKDSIIHATLKSFLSAIDDYREAIITSLPKAAKNRIDDIKKIENKIKKYTEKTTKDDEIVLINAHEVKKFFDVIREKERLDNSKLLKLMARSYFIGIFTEYDRFIGALLQAIYDKKPELYKGIKKEISLTDLLEFASISDIKKELLEQEIDAFRRSSYTEQFSDLEKKFDLSTLKKFDEWPKFVEMAQRRNVMTHNGGCVSQQYLFMCEKEGVKFTKKPKIGEELVLDPEYLFQSIRIISKVGFMLTHTLWRKLFPEEKNVANDSMNDSIYYLLSNKRWKAASEIGCFALEPMMIKDATDILKRIRIVNTAIALKNDKNAKKAIEILESLDWSASIREFKLANAIIRDNESDAAEIMKEIGKNGEFISELSYYEWPLFEDFRGTESFQGTFKEIYGHDFQERLSNDMNDPKKKKNKSKTKTT
jgi:hypothetical protein